MPPPPDGPIALLHNPVAGGGRGRAVASAFVAAFGRDARVFATPPPGVALDTLAAELAQSGVATLCIAGGDGTLHLAMNVLLTAFSEGGAWPRLALLPSGSANDGARALARHMDHPRTATWQDALATLAARCAMPDAPVAATDVGLLRAGPLRRAFANFAAVGSPADWAELSARRWLAPLKRVSVALAYQLCNLAVITRRRIHEVDIGLDRAPPQPRELFAWFAANARFLGGGLDFGEQVRLDSGRLAVVALPRAPRRTLVRLLKAAKRGQGLASQPVQHIALRLNAPARLNLDGELVTLPQSDCELSVLPGRAVWR